MTHFSFTINSSAGTSKDDKLSWFLPYAEKKHQQSMSDGLSQQEIAHLAGYALANGVWTADIHNALIRGDHSDFRGVEEYLSKCPYCGSTSGVKDSRGKCACCGGDFGTL